MDPENIVTKRNKVLDILRGHFLLAILVDHFHKFPSIFEYYNGKGDLWVSAATGFVFISGLLLGVINFPKIKSHGMSFVAKHLIQRGVKLYFLSVLLTVLYSILGLYLGKWPYIGQGILYTNSKDILQNALLFKYSYGWADLLIFYAILLLISPLVIFLVHKGRWRGVLIVSFCLWLYAFITPGLQRYTGSYFPVISWQFLFVLGIIVGKYRSKFSTWYRRYFTGEVIFPKLVLVISFFSVLLLTILDVRLNAFSGRTKEIIDLLMNKLELGPGRIIAFFIWFTFLYVLVHTFYAYIAKYLGWLYFSFGKNSLLTYTIQSVILFASFYISTPGGFLLNSLITVFVILLNWVLVEGTLLLSRKLKLLNV